MRPPLPRPRPSSAEKDLRCRFVIAAGNVVEMVDVLSIDDSNCCGGCDGDDGDLPRPPRPPRPALGP